MSDTELGENSIPQPTPPDTTEAKTAVRARVAEKIRSELNIEKWPAIWQPAKSKNKPALRTMERELSGDDGSRVLSRVEVGYTQLGTLTTEEQKLLYVLIKLWEDSGKPDAQVFFSTRALARMLKKKGWGTNVIQAITRSLRKLRTIPIEWINSYFDQTNQGAVLVDRRPFTILGELRVVESHKDGAVNRSLGYFKFDDHIVKNLQLNYTKPVCIEEFFKLKSEIAQLIYSHADLMLFDKSRYERRSRELFDDLGLKNVEYNHMYERKRALSKALKELEGIRLSSGVLRSATIEKTKDGKDYKVLLSKAATPRIDPRPEEEPMELAVRRVVVNNYSERKDALQLQGEELVQLFYSLFHGVENRSVDSRQVAQAISLIAHHGFEAARFLVEYSCTAAKETNYRPQTFGGILQYSSRAIAAYEASREPSPALPVIAASRLVPEAAADTAWMMLTKLADTDYQRRFEDAKAELLKNPFIARHYNPESAVIAALIRSIMLKRLTAEEQSQGGTQPVGVPDAVDNLEQGSESPVDLLTRNQPAEPPPSAKPDESTSAL